MAERSTAITDPSGSIRETRGHTASSSPPLSPSPSLRAPRFFKSSCSLRFSLVIPFHNEAGNIAPLLERTWAVLESLGGDWEAVLVDDGSTDSTAQELRAATSGRNNCGILTLAENRGQAAALLAGLQRARGEIILTMDGDGQNDPADFPRLIAPIESGTHDVACGVRTPRNDPALRRAMSRIANRVRQRVLRDGVDDAGCQLRAFRREVIAALQPSPLLQAFIPAMAVAAGFRVTQMPVQHHARVGGRSKYGLHRLWWRPFAEMMRLRRVLKRTSPLTKGPAP